MVWVLLLLCESVFEIVKVVVVLVIWVNIVWVLGVVLISRFVFELIFMLLFWD